MVFSCSKVRTRRYVNLAGEEHVINMTIVEPYTSIVQHAGEGNCSFRLNPLLSMTVGAWGLILVL